MINTPFWYTDISILYEKDSITEIFPSKRFDILRKLNAIVRLSILYTLVMYALKREQKYLVIPLASKSGLLEDNISYKIIKISINCNWF